MGYTDDWDLLADYVWHPLGMVPYPWLLMSIRRRRVRRPLPTMLRGLEYEGLITRLYLPSGDWFMPGPAALAAADMPTPDTLPPFDLSEIKPAAEDFDWKEDLLPLFKALPWSAPTAAVVLDMNGTTDQWPDLSDPEMFPAAVDTLEMIEREYLPALPDPGMADDLAAHVLGTAWLSWPEKSVRMGEEMRESLPGPGGIPVTPIAATLTGWLLSDGLFRSGREMAIRAARHPSTRQRLESAGRWEMSDEIAQNSRRRMEQAERWAEQRARAQGPMTSIYGPGGAPGA